MPGPMRQGNVHIPAQVLPRQRLLVGHDFRWRAHRDHGSSMHARAWTQVENVVRAPHRLGVVLDHDHGIAEVPEPPERVQQPLVVPLVQADGRLIQDIQHADQAGADLRGQADALALSAGERGRGPIQRQIV